MKIFLYILLLTTSLQQKTFAISVPDSNLILKAIKGTSTTKYKIGNYLKVFYKENLTLTGHLIAVSHDSIILKPLKKNCQFQKIAIADITAIKKIHKNGRRGWIPFFSLMIGLTIFGIIIIDNPLSILVLAGPVISLYTALPFLIASFLSDILSKKSKKNGWAFFSAPSTSVISTKMK